MFEQARRETQQAAELGPAQIKGDLQTIATAVANLTAALAAVGYEAAGVPSAAIAAASSPPVQQASAAVAAYNQTVCGA